ncbi:MAG: hypothetical protein HYU88_13675, partial [Chloroflexi bacterium]|nr:hypothetical protein [Chloroflexota bacterium]
GGSHAWYPVPGTQPGFVGAATVEGGIGSQLVGIVNQVNLTDLPGDTSLSYEAGNR